MSEQTAPRRDLAVAYGAPDDTVHTPSADAVHTPSADAVHTPSADAVQGDPLAPGAESVGAEAVAELPASSAPDEEPAPVADNTAAARAAAVQAPATRTAAAWRWARQQWALGVLVVLVAVFGIANSEAFLSGDNIKSIAVNASSYLIIAIGMTFVITIAGIDLGVGSVLVFSGVVSVKAMVAVGGNSVGTILLGLLVCLTVGGAWGLVNGLVITRTKVQPLVVTLGTLFAALGLAQVITGGTDITGVPQKLVNGLGFGSLAGVPYTVIVALAVAGVGAFVMTQTKFGRHTSAIGSNEEAARRAAIDISRHIATIYVICGVLAGLAGFVSLARFSTTTLNGHQNDMLQAILAVVIGGSSLSGGVARMGGTVIGVLIPATLQSGFVILGIEPFWQNVAMGTALVVVVGVDQRRRARTP